MASTYSPLKIELIGTGDQSGTWGATTNINLGENGAGLEQAIVGKANLETGDFTSNSYTLPYTNTNGLQDFRALVLDITATLSAAGTVIVPAIQKPYIILNNSVGGYAVTVKVSGQTGVSVPNGAKILVYNNGTDVGTAITYLTSLTTPSATITGGTIAGITQLDVSGTSAAGANLKLYEDTDNGTNYVSLKAADTIASNVTFTLPAADGTNGQVLQTNGSGTLSFTTPSSGISTGKAIAMAMIFGY